MGALVLLAMFAASGCGQEAEASVTTGTVPTSLIVDDVIHEANACSIIDGAARIRADGSSAESTGIVVSASPSGPSMTLLTADGGINAQSLVVKSGGDSTDPSRYVGTFADDAVVGFGSISVQVPAGLPLCP